MNHGILPIEKSKNTSVKIILGILILSSYVNLYGQKGYYATDSTIRSGVKVYRESSTLCKVELKDGTIMLTPDKVAEFKVNSGEIYVSKDVYLQNAVRKVFLEQLVKGETSLFYYREGISHSFFLQKGDSDLIHVPQIRDQDYKDILAYYTNDCSQVADAVKLVRYNKKSFTRLVKSYNNCELKPFPHIRFGLTGGYAFNKIKPYNELDVQPLTEFSYTFEGMPTAGAFIDIPLLASDMSIYTELNFAKYSGSYKNWEGDTDLDAVINMVSLNLPIRFRYAYPRNGFRPFVDLGGVFTCNISRELLTYETDIQEDIIEIQRFDNTSMISSMYGGYSFGGGILYDLSFKRSLSLSFHINGLYPFSKKAAFNITGMQLSAGINI